MALVCQALSKEGFDDAFAQEVDVIFLYSKVWVVRQHRFLEDAAFAVFYTYNQSDCEKLGSICKKSISVRKRLRGTSRTDMVQ